MRTFTLLLLMGISMNMFGQFGLDRMLKKATKKHVNKQVDKHEENAKRAAVAEVDKQFVKLEAWEDEQLGFIPVYIDENFMEPSDIQWQRLKFASGENVIFYDKPFNFEKKRSQPTFWDLDPKYGKNVSVEELDMGKAVLAAGPGYMTPKMDNASEDYLPNKFTLEFDYMMMITPKSKPIKLYFYAKGSQSAEGFEPIIINQREVWYRDSVSSYPLLAAQDNGMANWYRISISFDEGLLKVYMNEREMIVYNDKDLNPTGVTLDYYAVPPLSIKSFLISGAPKTIYDQIREEGKFTSYNIDYNIHTSKLPGISLSELTKIAAILIKNPDMKMDIDVYFSHMKREDENNDYGAGKTEAVKRSLIAMGVEEEQINVVYKGSIISSEINPKNRFSEAVVFTKK